MPWEPQAGDQETGLTGGPIDTEIPNSSPDVAQDGLIWQLVDSAFPSGGFAHSGGLEAACRWMQVNSTAQLEEFLRHSLVQMGRGSVPFLVAAHDRLDRFGEVDCQCDAFLNNHVANRASRLQGQAFLAAAESAFGAQRIDRGGETVPAVAQRRADWLTKQRRSIGVGQSHLHLAVVFGGVTSLFQLPVQQAVHMFLYTNLRDLISAAVRLNIVGSLEAQSIQFRLSRFANHVGTCCWQITPREATQTAPMADLFQATHRRLYTRLFQS
ncbi:MAG: urease accessory UreF family protein [Planctomycetaceae bacterium]